MIMTKLNVSDVNIGNVHSSCSSCHTSCKRTLAATAASRLDLNTDASGFRGAGPAPTGTYTCNVSTAVSHNSCNGYKCWTSLSASYGLVEGCLYQSYQVFKFPTPQWASSEIELPRYSASSSLRTFFNHLAADINVADPLSESTFDGLPFLATIGA